MTARVWFGLIVKHSFRIALSRLPRAFSGIILSLLASPPATIQHLRYDAVVAGQRLPRLLFIVGHWRSGTTLLHELLATDPRIFTPTLAECTAPDHFMITKPILRGFNFLVPGRRPTDDIPLGWDRPMEDEFALLALGVPSPYEMFMFPADRADALAYLDIAGRSDSEIEDWLNALTTIVKRVVVDRRIRTASAAPDWFLLKSPTHTARIGVLAEAFPDAKFIHLTRNPFDLAPSTERLFRALFQSQGLQRLSRETADLLAFVNTMMWALYRNFEKDVGHLSGDRWAELRFQDLVADPEREVTRLRKELDLGSGDEVSLRRHIASIRGYQPARHNVDPTTAARIRQEWQWYFDRFGYNRSEPEKEGG